MANVPVPYCPQLSITCPLPLSALQHVLVVQQLDLVALSDGSMASISSSLSHAPADGQPTYGFDPLPFSCAGHTGDGFQRGGFDLSFMLVNGVAVAVSPPGASLITWRPTGAQPIIALPYSGLPVLLRILNASPGRPYMLVLGWDSSPPAPGDALPPVNIFLTAIDGIDLAVPTPLYDGLPLASLGPGLNITGGLLLPPGGRYDLSATLQSRGLNSSTGAARPTIWGNSARCAHDTPACPGLSPFPIASFHVADDVGDVMGSTACNASVPSNATSGKIPPPCEPTAPLVPHGTISDGEVSVRRRFVLSEQREQPLLFPGDDGAVNREIDPLSLIASGFYINNKTFSPDRIDVPGVLLGSAGKLRVRAAAHIT